MISDPPGKKRHVSPLASPAAQVGSDSMTGLSLRLFWNIEPHIAFLGKSKEKFS